MRTCTIDGCDRTHRARGLCATHYNQQHHPNRHPKREYSCDACGVTVLKDAGRDKKYSSMYCSDLCKNYDRFGGCSSRIPSDHWARWYGLSSEWVAPFTRNTGDCAWCGGENPRGRAASFCTPTCRTKAKRVRRIGRQHETVGTYTWAQVVRLWANLGMRCAYCQRRTRLHMIQAEHVVPLSRGGENHIGNILPSCGPCNSDKRDLMLHEWNADRIRRGLHTVRTTWADEDPCFSHLHRTPIRLSA